MPGRKEQSWNPVRILSVLYHCVHPCPSFRPFCSLVSFSGTTFSPKGWRSRPFRPNHQVFPLWCLHLVSTVASGRDCPLQRVFISLLVSREPVPSLAPDQWASYMFVNSLSWSSSYEHSILADTFPLHQLFFELMP